MGDVLLIKRQPRDTLKPWDTHAEHAGFHRRTDFGASRTIPADPMITAGTAADSWISPPEIKQTNASEVSSERVRWTEIRGRLRVWWWKTTSSDNGHRGAVSHRFCSDVYPQKQTGSRWIYDPISDFFSPGQLNQHTRCGEIQRNHATASLIEVKVWKQKELHAFQIYRIWNPNKTKIVMSLQRLGSVWSYTL